MLDAFFDCFLLHLWKQGLQLNPEPIDSDTPASPPLVSPVFTPYLSSEIIFRLSLLSGFLVSAGDPNTGPHACSASAVPTKPWHQPPGFSTRTIMIVCTKKPRLVSRFRVLVQISFAHIALLVDAGP